MSIAQSLACSFYNPADGTVVQFNRIHQDSSFSRGGSDEEDAAGGGVFNGEEASLELVVYADDQAKLNQIRTWQDAETPVRFIAAGTKSSVIWDVARPVTLIEPGTFSPLTRSTATITMNAKGVRLPIWQGENLLDGFVVVQGFETGWQDSDSDGTPDGYDIAGTFANSDFTNDIFITGDVSSGGPGLEIRRPFPVSGISLTISGEMTQLHVDGISSRTIQQLNYSNSILSTDNEAYNTLGRDSNSVVSESGIYFLSVRPFTLVGVQSIGEARFRDPSLRLDGSDKYVAG